MKDEIGSAIPASNDALTMSFDESMNPLTLKYIHIVVICDVYHFQRYLRNAYMSVFTTWIIMIIGIQVYRYTVHSLSNFISSV